MSSCRPFRAGWLHLLMLAALALLVSCGGAVPPPVPPLRELPKSTAALLAMAPKSYGDPTTIDFGADDRGSAQVRAAFEAATGRAIAHEPSLDLVAAVLGRAYSEEPVTPAYSLTQWIYWKCGFPGAPGPSNVLVVDLGLEQAYSQHLADMVQHLPRSTKAPLVYGLVRLAVPGGSFQALALGFRSFQTATLPKSQAPGATLSLKGLLQAGFSEPSLYMDTESGEPAEVPVTLAPDGQLAATLQLPSRPGRYFLQIKAADPKVNPGDIPWNRSVFWAPLYVGVEEPLIADEFIRKPPKNHADRSSWPIQILNAYNAERARVGRQPLSFLREASLVAQASSDEKARIPGEAPPDPGVVQRLADAGVPPRDLLHSSGWLEYVAEYTQMRLLQPWVRRRVLSAGATVLALGISERGVEPRRGEFSVTEYVFEPVKVDPAKDGDRVLTGIEGIETAGGRKPPERDAKLGADAQRIAAAVCAGGKLAEKADEIWSQVTSRNPQLLHRMASITMGYDIGKEDIAYLAQPLSGEIPYTRMGIGICQGRVDGHANVTYALALFVGP